MASGDESFVEIDGGVLEGVRLLLCFGISIHVVKLFFFIIGRPNSKECLIILLHIQKTYTCLQYQGW